LLNPERELYFVPQSWGAQMSPYGHRGLVTGRFCWMLVHDGPDATIYTDTGGLIRFWNVSAERLFGYSAREAIGRPLEFVIPETCRERYWETGVEASPQIVCI
jgi:PAS domain-containing protein